MSTKYTCCERVSLGTFYGSKLCGKTAKFDRDGRHYCGTHDPVTSAEKQAAKTATWKAEWAAKDAALEAATAKRLEIERRADCYPELLEALKEVIRVFDGCPKSIVDTVWVTHLPSITLYDFCQAVIAKTKGETK